MQASKMIRRLQYLIDKHGDFQVDMWTFVCDETGKPIGEVNVPIKQIKYRKNLDNKQKFFVDFMGGF